MHLLTLGYVQRLYDFLRRHPTWVDGFWAVVLLGVTVVMGAVGTQRGDVGADGPFATLLIMVLLCVVITLRRRMPERMLVLAAVLGVAQLLFDVPRFPPDFAFLVIVYTVASTRGRDRRVSRLALAAGLCATLLAQFRWPVENGSMASHVGITVFETVPFVLAWVLGDWLRTRRAHFAQLEERAARLEREREARAKFAVAAERARIARELHDVVTHNVSAMVVQADGAAYVLDSDNGQARKALETISITGRQALAEMRRLLGVLSTGESREGDEYVPQPGVGQIDELVEQCRDSGLPVDFRIEGTARPLPSGVELTAYRIVQEALTNTRKHGGPDAGASVRLVYFDDGLGLLIEDDGKGAADGECQETGTDGQGHGLIGMRERVGMVGGTLDAGPRPGGGFRISALLPLKPAR